MVIVKTLLAFAFTLFTLLFLIPFGFLAFLLSFLGMETPMSWFIYKIAQIWSKGIIFVTGCSMEVKGQEHIPRKGGVCFVSNHVGIFDIILALAYIGRPFGFIAKKELSYIPFLNVWIYILGGFFIDRGNIRNSIKTIDLGIQKLKKGKGMLIFPEGTRSKGQGLLPFRPGALKLATQSLVPIVPMAISGSYDVFEKDHRVHAAPVRLTFCPPLITAGTGQDERRKQLAERVCSIIQVALETPPL
jgi:1-acyl-sn-glycerol-3-phosphate acyltransferase